MLHAVGRLRYIAAGVLVLLLAGAAAATQVGDESPAERAVEVLDDDAGFTTAVGAGHSFLAVSELLRAEGEGCARDGEQEQERACEAWFAVSGYTQIVAVNVVECTAPGIFDARAALRDHVERLRAGDADNALPPVPRC